MQVAALIVENTFTSIPDMAATMFPALRYVPRCLIRSHFNSIGKVASIRVPVLFLSGLQDELVPSRHVHRARWRVTLSDRSPTAG